MPLTLFDEPLPVDNSPLDDTEITTTILYYSKEELARFKKLCKTGIKDKFGPDFQAKGNVSDFILKILEERYGNL